MMARQILVCLAALSILAPSVSIAQSRDQIPAQEEAQGVDEEEDAKETKVDIVEHEEELKNGLLFGFSHAFRLVRNRQGAAASDLRSSDHVYGFLFGYERILHRYLALSIIKPFYFNGERVDSSLELEFGYELAPKSATVEHAFADSYQGAYFF